MISPSFRAGALPGWPHFGEGVTSQDSTRHQPGPNSLSLLLSPVQLLSSLTECLTVDPLSTSVWRQLYPKHLPQSRQVVVVGWGGTCSDPHRKALPRASQHVPKSRRGVFLTVQVPRELPWASRKLLLCGWGVDSRPEGAGPSRRAGGWDRPSGPPDGKGLCFPHSLLLEHLLKSWERIPKKVSCW